MRRLSRPLNVPILGPMLGLFVLGSGLTGAVAACTDAKSEPAPSPPPEATPSAAPSEEESVEPAEEELAEVEPEAEDAPSEPSEPAFDVSTYEGPFIGALFSQTPIMDQMAWPKKDRRKGDTDPGPMRIGYIRRGQKVPVLPEKHVNDNCSHGWYELVQGGFVCARYATLDLNHPKFKHAPKLPDMTAPLPYQYGYNLANGTPLYRTVPSRAERLKLEPWLAPKPKPKPKPAQVDEATASYGEESLDAGVPLTLAKATTITATTTDPFGLGADELDAGTPWYLQKHDGGKPVLSLDDLKGEGPVDRRMVKGFFVGLDEQFTASGSKWWKTTFGKIAPFERIWVYDAWSKSRGVWLDESLESHRIAEAAAASVGLEPRAPYDPSERKPTPNIATAGSPSQIAFVLSTSAKKYAVSPSRKAVIAGEPIPRHTPVRLTGESLRINGAVYEETDEGWWLRGSQATKTNPSEPPKELGPNEKWIDLNLTTQTIVAFEGTRPVFASLVSTGRKNERDKKKDYRTPTGTFRVREKHIAATMDADVDAESPYSIEDVPWIMYYSGGYAIHGAFWHNSFGRTRSHGCTNLTPTDAKALFEWAEPRVPDNWHAVWSTKENPGTLIVVHD